MPALDKQKENILLELMKKNVSIEELKRLNLFNLYYDELFKLYNRIGKNINVFQIRNEKDKFDSLNYLFNNDLRFKKDLLLFKSKKWFSDKNNLINIMNLQSDPILDEILEKNDSKAKPNNYQKSEKRDFDRSLSIAISLAVKSGKTFFGTNSAIESAMFGNAKAFVLANNTPDYIKQKISYFSRFSPEIEYIHSNWNSKEFGSILGRPHKISILTVLDPGDSKILSFNSDLDL